MRLHRFYISEKIGNQTELAIRSAELVNQVRRVFRLKAGDDIVLFDGTGFDYECKIDSSREKSTIVSDSVIRLIVTASRRSRFVPERKIVLCAAIVKKDTFEWIVEKATELGVTDIIPIAAERSEKKSLNEARLRKIAIEASEQSGRGATPMVHGIMGPGEAAEFLKKEKEEGSREQGELQMVAFHTEGEAFERSDLSKTDPLAVFIGPEGGWSEDELDLFHKNEISIRCLGPQVLRAETAVIAALSQVVFDN
jgi:16S rRNA (uracil1498-N3)-methyltransferase